MSAAAIKPWVETVVLHPDVLSDQFSENIFALDLGPLGDGNPQVPAVYRDPEQFFRASYLTQGLQSLLRDVLSRLSSGPGSPVLKLITPFGGGKSHTLASLFHAACNRKAVDAIPEGKGLPNPGKVNTAVFDGQFFSATNGKDLPDKTVRANTMWGWIAWSLAGKNGYDIIRKDDEGRVAPGGDDILKLLGDAPNLILLDEVLEYLISAGGIKVHDTTLRDETVTFIKRLTVAVSNTPKSALIFSLQSSSPRQTLGYANLFQTLDHMAARKDQLREPVEGNEVLRVIQRRLLDKMPTEADSTPAAMAYQDVVTQMRRAYARTAAEQQQAEQEGLELRDRIRDAYPFHPALIDLMRERWAAIPDFQRTRGALRFLAVCLRSCHTAGTSRAVLGPGEVPIHDQSVRLAFFKEVGQQADFQACLEHDLVGANARARRIDERRAKEFPGEAIKRPAMRIATAILMYSFGGLRREGAKETEILPPGITEPDLLSICVGPDLDSTTVQACLKELKEQCLYLHFDGVRYCFKKDPNVTLLIEQEADIVSRDEDLVQTKIKDMLEARIAANNAVVWPVKTADVPHKEPIFIVVYMPFDCSYKSKEECQLAAKETFQNYGDTLRQYRNGLALAVPSKNQIEILRRAVRYLLAIERIKGKAKQHNLTDVQKDQLKEREATEKAAAESAFLKLYTEVWFPKLEGSSIVIDPVDPGGMVLQTTLNEKKEARIHDRVMELITQLKKRVFDSVSPTKIVELFKLGEGTPPTMGINASDIVSGFYSFLGFTRLTSDSVIRKALARGVKEGTFAYTGGGVPARGPDDKYQIASSKIRFETVVAEDEIDLESGFVMMPQAMPQVAPEPIPAPTPVPGGPQPISPAPTSTEPFGATAGLQTQVDITFSAGRNKLFAAWNALANLADMSGTIQVNVHADKTDGFDKSKLENGVLEPLREEDLID